MPYNPDPRHGVGANPGFGLTRSLASLGHQVIAADTNPLAPGCCPASCPGSPPGRRSRHVGVVAELCRELAVDAVVAGIENDLLPLLDLAPQSVADGGRLWLPDAE